MRTITLLISLALSILLFQGCISQFPSEIDKEEDLSIQQQGDEGGQGGTPPAFGEGADSGSYGAGGQSGTAGTSGGTGGTGTSGATGGYYGISVGAASFVSAEYDYVAYSDSIRIYTNQNYCYDNQLVRNVRIDIAYTVSGDNLWLTGLSATGPLQEELLIKDKEAVLLSRNGTGGGLEGTWTLEGARGFDGKFYEPSPLLGTQTVTFKDSTLSIAASKPQAELELAILGALVTLDPNLSVDVLNDSTLFFAGKRTSETVTVFFYGYHTVQYISSNRSNPVHTFYTNPESCPNEPAPEWFYDFIKDNSGLVKSRR